MSEESLEAPVALAATEVGANSFQANWEAVEDADEYRLDVATDEGFESILAGYDDLNVGNVTSYVVEGLDAATDYWYRLRSWKAEEAEFSPADIDGLGLWLDGADEETMYDSDEGGVLVGSDGDIGRWEDKSAAGRHAKQSMAAQRPKRKDDQQKGLSVVRFDGADDRMPIPDGLDILRNVPGATVFLVAKANTSSDEVREFFRASRGDSGESFARNSVSRISGDDLRLGVRRLDSDSFASLAGGDWSQGYEMFAALTDYQNGRGEIFQDGESVAVDESLTSEGNTSDTDSLYVAVGAPSEESSSVWSGDIAEIIVYQRALTGTERQQVEEYLREKWLSVDSPNDLAGLTVWLDSDDAGTLYDSDSNGDLVAPDGDVGRWEDKSGNDNHVKQATAAERPTRKTEVQNGRDVVRFTENSDWLQSDAFAAALSQSNTIFVVGKGNMQTPNRFFYDGLDGGRHVLFSGDGTKFVLWNTAGFTTDRDTDENWNVLAALFEGSASRLWKNGVASATGDPGSGDMTGLTLAGRFNENRLAGDIAEIVVYDRALSSKEREQVEEYLQAKWATPALPE